MNNLLVVGLLGYIAMLAKSIPAKVSMLLINSITSSISVNDSTDFRGFKLVSEYLIGLNKNSINNNLEIKSEMDRGKWVLAPSIGFGTYLIRLDMMTYALIRKDMYSQTREIFSSITIRLFGLKRHSYYKELRCKLNNKDEEGILLINNINTNRTFKNTPKKTFDDIFIDDKSKKYIIDSIDKWLYNKELLDSKGIIHKLGILLYGKPGTGKSSIVRAIANKLEYPIEIINLPSFKDKPDNLQLILNTVYKHSIVLFEDIDCIIGDRSNESKDESILNILLNFIDGVASPDDCIIIATTNHIEKLDSAFTRSGRFDCKVEMCDLQPEIARKMCESFGYKLEEVLDVIEDEINPSYLQNKIIEKMNNIEMK